MPVPYRPPDRGDELTAGYWEGFEEREVRLPRCRDCAAFHWYPKRACPRCGSERVEWEAVSGRATLFTWVGVEYDFRLPFFEEEVPLYTGLVLPEEDESIRLPAVVEVPEGTEPEIGMALEASFVEGSTGSPVPVYVPHGGWMA